MSATCLVVEVAGRWPSQLHSPGPPRPHQGRSWAEIARFVGQRKLSLTADVYTHVLSDGRELDYGAVLA